MVNHNLNGRIPDNIIDFTSIQEFFQNFSGQKVVFCGGCFDIFHYGHLVFLQNAKAAGDILIVQIESDESIVKRKNRQPVHNQKQRSEIIASVKCVDYVLPIPYFTSDEEYGRVVSTIRPDIIAVTKGDVMLSKKERHANECGARVKAVCEPFESFSSSFIGKYEGIFGD